MTKKQKPAIGLVGDVMISTPSVASRRATVPQFEAALKVLSEHAVVIANLEMPLSLRGYRVPKHSNLRSSPEIIDEIVAMGCDAVSLANNHMMDYGPDALMDTIVACERVEILACGAGTDLDAAMAPVILETMHGRIGMISVACTLPIESDAGPGKPGIAPLRVNFAFEIDSNLLLEQPGTMPIVRSWANPDDQERVCAAIGRLKQQVDYVVVSVHWGVPQYWLSPNQGLLAQYQQPLGRALIDAGGDVICGHHAHGLHPIEIYKGRPILYSLGNFVFQNPRAFMEPESVIVSVTPGDEFRVEFTPVWVDEAGFPMLATGERAQSVMAKLEGMSTTFGTRFERRNDRTHVLMSA